MDKFIEYTDKRGFRNLVNLKMVETVVDRNKTIIVKFADDSELVTLPIAYETFTSWVKDSKPILEGCFAL